MRAPVCDFASRYAAAGPVRMHMPGHKGAAFTGCEGLDITEIAGADWLYAPEGIIRESENNAAGLFGAGDTLYSTEGSSQCIRAMACLALWDFAQKGKTGRPVVLAGRNAHKAFLTAAALLDFDVLWLYPENKDYSLCRCDISPATLAAALERTPGAAAVYITSPDYLGNCADIKALAQTAHQKGVPLLVDNAHGAYRAFLPEPLHPMALGADMCCDSAHKTLPVLTGGAYLHIAKGAPGTFHARGREAMALFGSTSPSYLILQSLDRANLYLSGPYPKKLRLMLEALAALKKRLGAAGWAFAGDEPAKLTLAAKGYGYTGAQVADYLEGQGVVCEYADPDYTVLMPTPENTGEEFRRVEKALLALGKGPAPAGGLPGFSAPERAMPIRQAVFSPRERVPVGEALGQVCAGMPSLCPPAVAPVVPGEIIEENMVEVCRYYGVGFIDIIKGGRGH